MTFLEGDLESWIVHGTAASGPGGKPASRRSLGLPNAAVIPSRCTLGEVSCSGGTRSLRAPSSASRFCPAKRNSTKLRNLWQGVLLCCDLDDLMIAIAPRRISIVHPVSG